MRSLNLFLITLVTFGLAACAVEPEATEIGKGVAPSDSRITYTIYKYSEPYNFKGVSATHKLTARTVIVETDAQERVRYIGLPDGVAPELGAAMDAVCRKSSKSLNQVEEGTDLQARRLYVYFNCA